MSKNAYILYTGFILVLNFIIYFIFSYFNSTINFNFWSTATCIVYTIITIILSSIGSLIFGVIAAFEYLSGNDDES